jgi:prevent-host-death family protein
MHDAKSSLSRLVQRAAAGEVILIAKHGKPVAMLSRIPASTKKIPWGIFKGKMQMAPDFDAPLEELKDYL